MQKTDFYQERISDYSDRVKQIRSKENRYTLYRVMLFLMAMVALISGLITGQLLLTLSSILIFGLFVRVVIIDLKIRTDRVFAEKMKSINEKEFKALASGGLDFSDGHLYQDQQHPYSIDLDIFGADSLFQLLNRTQTQPGCKTLADWLKQPTASSEIILRQACVQELADHVDWRQELQAQGTILSSGENYDINQLKKWLAEPNLFYGRKKLNLVRFLMPLFSITSALLVLWGLPVTVFLLFLTANMFILYAVRKQSNKVYLNVTNAARVLKSYLKILKHIETANFKSAKLKDLKASLTKNDDRSSDAISKLIKLIDRFDLRNNLLLYVPLNLVGLWDIHQLIGLEKWKSANHEKIHPWFDVIGELEAISSLANLRFNQEDWVLPDITAKYFTLQTEGLGHPLIPERRRIVNDFTLKGRGKVALITGSNMAGKTTFLRTIGVNLVLAMAGAPVCAKKFLFSPVRLMSSMRTTDSLADNTSSFYAELKRLKGMLGAIKMHDNTLLLLDEILKGTNSSDRHKGAEALVKQIIRRRALGLLATHDLELGRLEKELPENIENYNFDVQIEGQELFFDYKLHHGICKSMNATILMKKMGIEFGND